MSSARRSGTGEVESLAHLEAVLASGRPLSGLRLQDLDLTAYESALLARSDLAGLVVLGGRLPPGLDEHLRAHHALIFPTDPSAPVDPYRASLYSPDELYAGLAESGYAATPDARAYRWSRDAALRHDAFVTLLRAIHDDSVADALDEFIGGRPVVGVMGGHDLPRGGADYADAARLGHHLAGAGLVVATGGGPGAMEAANLGAFAADEQELGSALAQLATVPGFAGDPGAWADLGLSVRSRVQRRGSGGSIGIPTWFYGHEPPNVFCDGIAKFFSNAIREDGLLARSGAGLVVLEGSAGTVQEVFQAITPLFYATAGTAPVPLVLVGQRHWVDTVPVWPAVQALMSGRTMATSVHLVDDVDEATALLTTTDRRTS